MIYPTLDLACVVTVFGTFVHVVAIVVSFLTLKKEQHAMPHGIIEGMVCETIHNQNLAPFTGKRVSFYFNMFSDPARRQNMWNMIGKELIGV